MKDCNCECSEKSTKTICEYLPKCTKYIRIFVGLDYVGQNVRALFIKHNPSKSCTSKLWLVDAEGFITVDVKEGFREGFFFKGWFINFKYQVVIFDENGKQIELTYESNKYCSLTFFVSECSDVETFTMN